jgi:outer membrane murein-binding lipoprotein Lpp
MSCGEGESAALQQLVTVATYHQGIHSPGLWKLEEIIMKTIPLVLAAIGSLALAGAVTPAAAQSLNARQARISQRIDQGVRSGQLTRNEAYQLRRRLWRLERTQYRYRRGGLSSWERTNLERRYDNLSNDVWAQKHDSQRRWR